MALRPQQNRDLGMVMREVDENLAIFLGAHAKPRHVQVCLVPTEEEKELEDSAPNNNGFETLVSLKPYVESVPSTDTTKRKAVVSSSAQKPGKPKSKPTSEPSSASNSRSKTLHTTPASVSSSHPTRRSSTPTRKTGSSSFDQTSSGRKPASVTPKNPISRTSKPLKLLSSSQDATENLKPSLPLRSASASRGRPNAAPLSSSKVNPRQQSCSPARNRVSRVKSREYNNTCDDDAVNPVLIGTKMVERVVNMRKLAPPPDSYLNNHHSKKASMENSGFGRLLSKKSLEMVIRHMDITRSMSITEDLRRSVVVGGKVQSTSSSECGSFKSSSVY